jgi:nucleoside-diphosphate-sugar epimerase
MRVLITGGAGYIGSILTPFLLAKGYQVTVLDNFMYKQNSLLDCCKDTKFNILRGDCRDKKLIKKLLAKHDVIIPLAAIVGAPLCDRDRLAAISINRNAAIMTVGLLSSDQRLVIPITNSGYGIGKKGEYCTEKSPLRPISLYGRTKVEAEEAVLEKGNGISLRLATVFGVSPRMRTDLLVNDFVYRAVFDKAIVLFEAHFKRNFIHIYDVARAFLHGIENYDSLKGEAYNVGLSNANLSKIELCRKIKEKIPEFTFFESQVGKDPDKRDYIISNEKIKKTGWVPKYSLDDGILELIKAYNIIKKNDYSNI